MIKIIAQILPLVKVKISILTFFIVLVFINNTQAQQDFQNSQYMFNFSTINPAYVGSRDVLDVSISHRSQWVGIQDAPTTQIVSLHAPITKRKIGIGVQITRDNIGPRDVIGLNTAYSYRIRIGPGKLSFGLRAGFYNYSYDWNVLEYENPEDEVIRTGSTSRLAPNFDFGIYYHDRLNYFGFESAHINRSKLYGKQTTVGENSARFYPSSSIFYGRAFEIKKNLTLKTSILYRATKASSYADINASAFLMRKLWIGLSFRGSNTQKALVFITQYYLTNKLRFGYSYDLTIAGPGSTSQGSHEIFLGYDIPVFKSENQSPRYF